jgi:hypothetical protein
MGARRRSLQRPTGQRRYKKLFLVSTEGSKTEPQYFELLNSASAIVQVRCLKHRVGWSPKKVLSSMTQYVESQGLGRTD